MKNLNYFDTFIEVAEDCPVSSGSLPSSKGEGKTIAAIQYELIARHPYQYTQEDILFETYAAHKNVPPQNRQAERQKFFEQSQACLRASPLGKRWGWGIHNDAEGKVAVYAVESDEYKQLANDPKLKHLKAMRSKRA